MRENTKKSYFIAGISLILFLILIVLLKTVDVAPVGPLGTNIGLSTLNSGFHDLTGMNAALYDLTGVLAIISLLTVGIFALIGLIQWIRRKNLLKVDREILAMGILFIVLLVIYIFFEKVIINYRPVIMPDAEVPEPSFPSSHTIMTVTVIGSVTMVLDKYVKNANMCKLIKIIAVIVVAAMVVGRLICGVHWLTDIVGAILMSVTLLELYYALKQ